LWQRHKAQRGVWSEKMLVALEAGVKGNVWFSLIDKVYADWTLELAWAKVQSNAGACGVDGITTGHFAKDSHRRLLAVKEHIKEGSYQPKPVKRVLIPKPGSAEKRPLGIPTVIDRVVQTAVRMVIEPIFEKEFAPQSYGFRPGCGCQDALRRVDELLQSGLVHVVDVDIKGYFDSIPHDQLLKLVRERIADGRVLKLIEAFLHQEVMAQCETVEAYERKEIEKIEAGTPQGGVISPLLANIYLNPLDWKMNREGHQMVRYADDTVILCPDAKSAAHVLQSLREWMAAAGLTLHPEKTKIVDMGEPKAHFDVARICLDKKWRAVSLRSALGYRFWRGTKGRLQRFIRPKSVKKFRDGIKPLTKRCNGQSMAAISARLKPKLRGFYACFKHASVNALRELDGWVRGRLRGILRKRAKLKGRGRGRDHHRWPNRYFTALGLFSLEDAWRAESTSLRKGAHC
jgi:RNA-directed DNA polymerase